MKIIGMKIIGYTTSTKQYKTRAYSGVVFSSDLDDLFYPIYQKIFNEFISVKKILII